MRTMYDEKLAQAAYLIGCQQTGEAIIIDPLRDVDRCIALAETHGVRLVAVAETHIHADFVSGARELAERIGARVYVSGEGGEDWSYRWLDKRLDGGTYDHRLLRDGDTFRIGNIEFRAVHTPGHTPEHLSFLVTDGGAQAEAPMGMVTGDFLFVGDLGRPDLLETAAGRTGDMEPAARRLFSTVRKLDNVPDFVQVWPAHGAGSACGKALGAVPTSTIGYERRFNPSIGAAAEEQSFIEYILRGQPEPPMYFANMKRVNRDGPAVLGGLPSPARVSVDDLRALDAQKVAILDTRAWDAFRAGHIPGALSFPLVTSFSTDVGSMVRADEDVYLVIDKRDLEEVIRDLVRIGIDRIRGWCAAEDVRGAEMLGTVEEVGVDVAAGLVGSGDVALLDVRRRSEFDEGHIADAVNIAHTRLAGRMDEVPQGARLLVNCRSGKRSARASAYLKRAGYEAINLAGGMLAWDDAGLPSRA
ncbi:MAG: MBL fold metallo-hydrolase [Planctomycetota bacterium]